MERVPPQGVDLVNCAFEQALSVRSESVELHQNPVRRDTHQVSEGERGSAVALGYGYAG